MLILFMLSELFVILLKAPELWFMISETSVIEKKRRRRRRKGIVVFVVDSGRGRSGQFMAEYLVCLLSYGLNCFVFYIFSF